MSLPRFVTVASGCVAFLATVVAAIGLHPSVRSVYRALSPSATYDSTHPNVPVVTGPAILVFSKTNGFRHFQAIEAGSKAIRNIAGKRGWSVFHTESGAVFEHHILSRFRVVVWHNASGAPLSQPQRKAFRDWLESGGGFVGIHAALDDSHASWDWYQRRVLGVTFIGHPLPLQSAVIRVERTDHSATEALPARWIHFDEWYSFDRSVRGDPGVEVLASIDESTYEPRLRFLFLDRDLSMGDHPAIWTRRVGAGRALLSALGHSGDAYRDPNYLAVLEGGIQWAGRFEPPRTEPAAARRSRER